MYSVKNIVTIVLIVTFICLIYKTKYIENFKNIEVYNVLGSLIHSEKTYSLNEIELNLSHLISGIYHLVLRSEDQILNQKVIIE